MKALKVLFVGLILFCFCYGLNGEQRYKILLRIDAVKREPIAQIKPEYNRFKDKIINIVFYSTNKKIDFSFNNLTNETIYVMWDECIFINASDRSSSIIHAGVRFAEKTAAQKPSLVAAKTSMNDSILPTDNINMTDSSGWEIEDIFPLSIEEALKEMYQNAEYRLILVIKKGATKYTYTIMFSTFLVRI